METDHPGARKNEPLPRPPSQPPRAFDRLAEIVPQQKGPSPASRSGRRRFAPAFQLRIALDAPKDDDLIIEGAGQKVVSTASSLPFLPMPVIDFSEN